MVELVAFACGARPVSLHGAYSERGVNVPMVPLLAHEKPLVPDIRDQGDTRFMRCGGTEHLQRVAEDLTASSAAS